MNVGLHEKWIELVLPHCETLEYQARTYLVKSSSQVCLSACRLVQ